MFDKPIKAHILFHNTYCMCKNKKNTYIQCTRKNPCKLPRYFIFHMKLIPLLRGIDRDHSYFHIILQEVHFIWVAINAHARCSDWLKARNMEFITCGLFSWRRLYGNTPAIVHKPRPCANVQSFLVTFSFHEFFFFFFLVEPR